MRRNQIAGRLLAALGVVLVALAAFGFRTRHAVLNLGPGDSPFVSGFERDHDVTDKVGWHWTTYDASVALPLRARGATLDLTLRYARMFREEATVEVGIGGVVAGGFRARGSEVRDTTVRATPVSGPLVMTLRTDSHERRNMGLRMDRLTVDVISGPGLSLLPGAALRPLLTAFLLGLGLLALGAGALGAGVGVAAFGVAFASLASSDLLGAWRLTHAAPALLALSTAVLFVLKWLLKRLGLLEAAPARALSAAALACMLFRLSLVSQPDFYYPDLMTHARVVETIRREGVGFFLDPARALAAQGAWTKPVMGAVSSLPYAVVFHAPFALPTAVFDWSLDEVETAIKSAACLLSVIPILLAGALAARLGLPPLAALTLAILPTHASRLSLALLPSLAGHLFDLAALLVLFVVFGGEDRPSMRGIGAAALALFVGHLSYTASVLNEGAFTALLASLLILRRATRASGVGVLVAEAVAALVAFAVYYRHFVGDVFGLAARITGLGGAGPLAPAQSVYAVQGFGTVLLERTNAYFGWSWMLLALAAFAVGPRARDLRRSAFLQSWGLAFLALIFLRARIPDVFRYGHETLFLAPLIAILAGSTVLGLVGRSGTLRALGWLTAGAMVAVSLREQGLAFAEQFSNAL